MSTVVSFDEHWDLVKKTPRRVIVRGVEYDVPEDLPLSYAVLSHKAEDIDKEDLDDDAKDLKRLQLMLEMQNEAMNYFFGPETIAMWSREGMGQKEFYGIANFVAGLFDKKLDEDVEVGDDFPKAGEAS